MNAKHLPLKFFPIFTLLILFSFPNDSIAQTDSTKSVKGFLKKAAQKASEALIVKPYYWQMSLQKPNLVETKKLEYESKDNDVNVKIYYGFGAGNLGQQGPSHVCFDITNLTDETITVNWDEVKVSGLKGDGVRNKVTIMHGSSTYKAVPRNIDSGEKTSTCISSTKCIRTYHHNGRYDDQGNWLEPWDQLEDFTVFCSDDFSIDIYRASLEEIKKEVIGKEFTFFIPMVIKGQTVKKTYTFKVEDVAIWQE